MAANTARVISWICGILAACLALLTVVAFAVWLFAFGGMAALGPGAKPVTVDPIVPDQATDMHYAVAQLEPVTVGDAIVRIRHASIRHVPGTLRGERAESPEELLVVDVQVSTETPGKKFDFHSWHERSESNSDGFRAVDDLGNHYNRVEFRSGFKVKGQFEHDPVKLNEPVNDRLVIEKPSRAAREIRLTLPSRNITGADGPEIRFRIELSRTAREYRGEHPIDSRDRPATEAEVRREAEKAAAERGKHATEEEVRREAEKAAAERGKHATEEEVRRESEKAKAEHERRENERVAQSKPVTEEEVRRQADKELEEQAARRAEREAREKQEAEAATVRAEMEAKAREKEKQREAEKEVSRRLDLEEKDAATLLKLARQFIDSDPPDKVTAAKKLSEIVRKYPRTQAAAEAKKLLAGLD